MTHSKALTRSIACLLAITTASPAATVTWDSNAATAPNPFDGAQTWDTATARFWNGVTNVIWNNANNDIAVFGTGGAMFNGVAGAVTVSGALTAGGLVFNDYTGNNTKYNITGGTSLTLAGANPTIQMNTSLTRPFAAINTVLAGTSGFTLSGNAQSIFELGPQLNTITGGYRIGAGALSINSDSGLGGAGNSVTFTGNSSLIVRATMTADAARSFTINSGVTASFDSLNAATMTIAGVVTGAGSFEKTGFGSVVLQNANTYAGETRVRQGTLTLDFNAASAPAENLVASSSVLRLFGGTLTANGKAGLAATQTFAGTVLDAGASSLALNLGSGTSLALNLGAITRHTGATLNVAAISANTSYSTTTTFANAVGWGTVNNADFFTQSGADLVALTAYQFSNDPAAWTASDNVSLAESPIAPLGTASINTLKTTAASAISIGAADVFTLGGGGMLITGTGEVTIGGGTLLGAAGGDLIVHQHNTASPTTISSVIGNNSGASGLVKSGGGTLVLSGANTYTGNTFVNAGILSVESDANLGAGSTVTLRAGTRLAITGTSAFTSAKNFQFDLGSNTYGAPAVGAAQGSAGNFTVNVSNTAGATISGAFNVTAGTFVKTGAGALTLTNPGVNRLAALNGGLAFTVEEGALTFDGGPTSEWLVSQGEFNVGIGDNASAGNTRSATVTLNSGKVQTGSWTAIGRGGGNIGNTYTLNVNGGTWNSGNLYTGFANGVGGYNATSIINVTNNGVINAGEGVRLAESAGGTTNVTISNNGRLNVNNSALQVGFAGTATLTLNDSANVVVGVGTLNANLEVGNTNRGLVKIGAGTSLSANQVLAGTGAAGSGAIWNRGTLVTRAGASINHFALGNAANAYGYYLHDTSVPSLFQEAGVGGAGGGSGVMEIRSGVVTAGQWMTLNRTNGANATSAQLLIAGGTLVPNNVAGRFYANQVATAELTTYINVGPGGRIQGGNATDINLNNAALAGHQTVLSIYSGGIVEAVRVFAAQATGMATVNMDGGTLRATAAGNILDNNLDAILIHAGGATIDTNGFATTTGATPLTAPTGNGITNIPVLNGGSGYIGRPIVKITDPTGVGASAVANFDETTGQVTGITITSPGSGYISPAITLVGGGAATPATLDPAVLAAATSAGGFTKTGAGPLTVSTNNTYGGVTSVTNGTLVVTGSNNAGGGVSVGALGTLNFGNNTVTGMIDGNADVAGTLNFERIDDLVYGADLTGTGVVNKNRANTLALTGSTSNFLGAVNVNAGTLIASGTYGGAMNVNSTARLVPVSGATGTLSVASFALNTGSTADFDFGPGAAHDQIIVGAGGTLTFGAAFTLNLYQAGTAFPFATNGTYSIFDYATAVAGNPASFSVGNPVPGKGYALVNNAAATTVDLTIYDVIVSAWTNAGSGLWSDAGNWSNGVPNSISSEATFGTAIVAPSTVDIDGPKTVGKVSFDNLNSYTIAGDGPLNFDNGAAAANITAASGSHFINTPIAMAGALTVNSAGFASVTIQDVAGAGALTKTGEGTLILNGNSAHAGGTAVGGGLLQVGTGGTTGTLPAGAIPLATGAALGINRSDAVTLPNDLSGVGSFVQMGSGTTTYTGTAAYTGATTVMEGSLVNQGAINGTSGLTVQNGTFANSGSVSTTGTVTVAGVAGANGTLTISDGIFTQTGATGIIIGANGGTGSYVQTGGVVTTGTAGQGFQLGVGGFGSNATATISGGTLNVANELWISNATTGNTATMTMSGGMVNIGSWLAVGRATGVGTLNLSGGTLTKTGGAGNFIIVGSLGGTGVINQTGGALNTTAGGIRLGENTGGTPALGTLWDMEGGTSSITGEVNVAWRSSEATWNIKPGATVTATGRLIVAAETSNNTINAGSIVNGAPVGTVNMTGGTATFAAGDSRIGGDNSAVSAGAVGAVNVTGGTMSFGGNLQIGAYGQGSMLIAGTGTVNSTGGFPVVGRYLGGVGTLNVDAGGTFNQTVAANALIIGEQGAGTFNVYGEGLANVENLFVGHTTTGAGTVNLLGGTLATRLVQRTETTESIAAFNFDGGTLRAKAASANFFPGFTDSQIKVEAGGAVVDTNGFDIAIIQSLGEGVTTGGGLRKQGSGTLTLAGVESYTGLTIVDAGTLSLTGSITGSVEVNAGGTLSGTGGVGGMVTVNSGGTVAPGVSPGVLSVGGLELNGGSLLSLELNAADAGSYDSLNVVGEVTLAGTLSLSGTYLTSPAITNDLFFVIINDGIDPIAGTFAGLPNGARVSALNGQDFLVSYFGDSIGGTATGGNDVVLQAVPEPGSAVLLLGGLALLASGRRRQK